MSRFTLDEQGFVAPRTRIPPARQNCHASCREIPKRPPRNECPICGKKDLDLVTVTRTVSTDGQHEKIMAYIIPTHLPKRPK